MAYHLNEFGRFNIGNISFVPKFNCHNPRQKLSAFYVDIYIYIYDGIDK